MKAFIWKYASFAIVGQNKCMINHLAITNQADVRISVEPVRVGAYCFEVGQTYTKLGKSKGDSWAGLQLNPGDSLLYKGLANDHFLLFRLVRLGRPQLPSDRDLFGRLCGRYQDIYLTFMVLTSQPGRLFWLTKVRKVCSIDVSLVSGPVLAPVSTKRISRPLTPNPVLYAHASAE